jgi:membrane protein implicated in regulation of membrane protease activity
VLGWILAAVFLAAVGAALMVGFITFTIFFMLLVPVLLLLLVVVLVLGRARFQIHVVRRHRTPQRGSDGPSGANRNP